MTKFQAQTEYTAYMADGHEFVTFGGVVGTVTPLDGGNFRVRIDGREFISAAPGTAFVVDTIMCLSVVQVSDDGAQWVWFKMPDNLPSVHAFSDGKPRSIEGLSRGELLKGRGMANMKFC